MIAQLRAFSCQRLPRESTRLRVQAAQSWRDDIGGRASEANRSLWKLRDGSCTASAVIEILEGNFCTSEDARAPRHKLHRELFAYFPRDRGPEKREREREETFRREIFPGGESCAKRSDERRNQVLHTHPPWRGALFLKAKSIIQISSGRPRAFPKDIDGNFV